jgi:nucleoid-associated protein YgaU
MTNPRNTPEPARPSTPRADFSDVKSGNSSETVSDQSMQEESYTVKKGDTLSAIAKQHYGDESKWPEIQKANSDLIRNPDLIHIGWVLKLPKL